jgi:hypothetical protein
MGDKTVETCTSATTASPCTARTIWFRHAAIARCAHAILDWGSRERVNRGAWLARVVSSGGSPFAVVSVDGGDTYWHQRVSGEDSGAMVLAELLPLLSEQGLDSTQTAGYGGGSFYGRRRGPCRVCLGSNSEKPAPYGLRRAGKGENHGESRCRRDWSRRLNRSPSRPGAVGRRPQRPCCDITLLDEWFRLAAKLGMA